MRNVRVSVDVREKKLSPCENGAGRNKRERMTRSQHIRESEGV